MKLDYFCNPSVLRPSNEARITRKEILTWICKNLNYCGLEAPLGCLAHFIILFQIGRRIDKFIAFSSFGWGIRHFFLLFSYRQPLLYDIQVV